MELRRPAVAGTTESSDVMIMLYPNLNGEVEIHLQSVVSAIFGDAIESTIRTVLDEFGIESATVDVIDKGALDCTIRARMQCAITRAAETKYDWTREDA